MAQHHSDAFSCPKCGKANGLTKWYSGPHYSHDIFSGECLHYSCMNCGYSWDEPTMDKRDGKTS